MVPEKIKGRARMIARVFQILIRIYQKTLSPLIGNQCRFAPTCSQYSYDAFERHGAIKGLFLTIRRLLKCHPWVKCEWHDPVPAVFEWKQLLQKPISGHKHEISTETNTTER